MAGVFAYIFSMVIDNIQERLRWPRALIVSVLYVLVLGVLGVGLYFGAEALFRQTREFIVGGPDILERGLKQIMGGATYQFGGETLDAHRLAQQLNAGLRSYFLAAGVALSAQGAGAAVGVIIAYTILRELEDQVVMPVVVGRAVNLHPVVTIFAVLAGGAIAGVLGMLLAVPTAAAIKVVLDILY